METEGRSFSEFYRNESEEIFLKTLMEGSMGMPAPTMEMLGFKNLSQNFRVDSEELFKNWLTTGENSYNSTGIPRHPRQAPRRISRELASLTAHHHHLPSPLQRIQSNEALFAQPVPVPEEQSNDPRDINQNSESNVAAQASNLYLAKAWFQSSQPMTRSRSSELRRRYVAMQNSHQTPNSMHNLSNLSHANNISQDIGNQNNFGDVSMHDVPNQFNSFMSPSNSSSSPFNPSPHTDNNNNVDKVSSVVSMLKDTLQRKKVSNNQDDHIQGQGSHHVHETLGAYQDMPCVQANNDTSFMQTLQGGSYNMELEHFVSPMNLIAASREPSQSESSAAATICFEVCDGPTNSGQTMSESSRRQANGRCSENGSKDIRDMIGANLKEEKKKGSLVRYGSVTSAGSVEKGDPTKKRRVERYRKMAEAKERNLTPSIPSDMQSILKRCENLEKEVRSLKLNLAFMNRKDSEQTKQIEELQKQNDDLSDEKERLLEEIERIL